MSNFVKDGESVRFVGSDQSLSPLQRAVANGGTVAPSHVGAAAPTADHKQGDVQSPLYGRYDRRLEDAWRGCGS